MVAGTHGSTYGGNPLAMAVANGVLDVMLAPNFMAGVDAMGQALVRGLRDLIGRHPKILKDVRGRGLIVGLMCHDDPRAMVQRLRDNGLLTVGAGNNVVRLLPPLVINENHIAEALEIIDTTCTQMEAQA